MMKHLLKWWQCLMKMIMNHVTMIWKRYDGSLHWIEEVWKSFRFFKKCQVQLVALLKNALKKWTLHYATGCTNKKLDFPTLKLHEMGCYANEMIGKVLRWICMLISEPLRYIIWIVIHTLIILILSFNFQSLWSYVLDCASLQTLSFFYECVFIKTLTKAKKNISSQIDLTHLSFFRCGKNII